MPNSELLKNLNEAQKQAVTHRDGPLLIIAGAGTGKTTVITSKIAWLVTEQGILPEQILALTFTEKAAAEMEERVDQLLPLGYNDLWISTFHAFCERILKEYGLEIGLPADFRLLTQTEQWLLVRQNLDRFNLKHYRPLGNPTKFIHDLLKLFSRAKDEEISADAYLEYAENLKLNSDSADFLKSIIKEEDQENLSPTEIAELKTEEIAKQLEIADAYHTYQQLLLENNALDFGDLINYTLKLFKTRKAVLYKYRSQFKYILVDEFQDTNWAQYELVKLLAEPKNNLTVVGDDDQSIYKFRGASVSNILQFKDDFPGAKEILLTDNYRSCQNILDLSYNFIQRNNPDRLEAKLSQGQKKLSKKLAAHLNCAGEISHLHGQTIADEVKAVTDKIIELYNADKETNWSDFAILVRANASADDFCYVLESADIPYMFMASRGLYGKKIILDIMNWFKVLDDYRENIAMFRILSLPAWQIGLTDFGTLNYQAGKRAWSLFEAAKQNSLLPGLSAEGRKKMLKIAGLIETQTARAQAGARPTELCQDFLEATGYLKRLTAKDNLENRQELNYLNQFYRKMQMFEKDNLDHSLNNFRALMELEAEAGEEGALAPNLEDLSPDSVRIMTVHSAKGLEFKYVFIANLVDRKFPSGNKSDRLELPTALTKEILPEGDAHLQEERRLFYVAMTRAKQGLYLSSAEDYGGARAKKLSRFLSELSEDGFALAATALAIPDSDLLTATKAKNTDETLPTGSKPLLPTISFTQLKSFQSCPYQYRFAHILRLPIKGKPVFSFGKTMHSTMQKFFILARAKAEAKQKNLFGETGDSLEISWEEVKELYEMSFVDEWYPDALTKRKYRDHGLDCLKKFFDRWRQAPAVALELEKGFTVKLAPEVSVRGAIDRIDEVNGGLRLIDYKTGSPKKKLEADDKDQLLIYQLAAEQILRQPVKELAYYYFDNDSELSFLGTPKELEKMKEKIIDTVTKIKRGKFPPQPSENTCKWCDYNGICDFRA
ncbi:MAG: UvrD-helicase domain-containing protein [Patescibacteria group bacterium]|jgi:DNA helicase-2/ATP-dependent DNA helicase PcrA